MPKKMAISYGKVPPGAILLKTKSGEEGKNKNFDFEKLPNCPYLSLFKKKREEEKLENNT